MNLEPKYDVTGVYRVKLKSDGEACLGRWSELAQMWMIGHVPSNSRVFAKDQDVEVLGQMSEADLIAAGCR